MMRSLLFISLYTTLHSLAFAANILLTSTDSWADKNCRYLYLALTEAGHNVVFVGSLSTNGLGSVAGPIQDTSITSQRDLKLVPFSKFSGENSGDYGHLKEANQRYFFQVRKLNTLRLRARKYFFWKKRPKHHSEFAKLSKAVVKNNAYGQDPLNPNFWYVNGSPLESLSIAFEVIIPKHLPNFAPDLVLIGPNEGLHLTYKASPQVSGITAIDVLSHPDQLEAMRLLVQVKRIPVISVSTEDASRIYYENEDVFNVEQPEYSKVFRSNHICKNMRFVNLRIKLLISRVLPGLQRGQALNVNFPLMNTQMSRCTTNEEEGPQFLQISVASEQKTTMGSLYGVPVFAIKNESVVLFRKIMYKVSEEMPSSEQMPSIELSRMSHLLNTRDTKADWDTQISSHDKIQELFSFCGKKELKALAVCAISVTVSDLARGSGLNESKFDLMKVL